MLVLYTCSNIDSNEAKYSTYNHIRGIISTAKLTYTPINLKHAFHIYNSLTNFYVYNTQEFTIYAEIFTCFKLTLRKEVIC